MSGLRVLLVGLVAGAVGLGGCGKSSYEEECKVTNQRKKVTVKGVLLKPSADLLLDCDEIGSTFRGRPGTGRGCVLPMYPKEGGKKPNIDAFFKVGTKPTNLKPLPKRFHWYKDIHIQTDDGQFAQLGDVIEVTGELDTYYGACNLAHIESVKLIEDKYGKKKK
jgi:hypothetical protein